MSLHILPAAAIASDADSPIAFLRRLRPAGVVNLVSIDPATKRVEGITRDIARADELAAWIDARNGRANLYFTPNEPRAGAPDGKLGKQHIASIAAVWIDVDPRKDVETQPGGLAAERERLTGLARDTLTDLAYPASFAIDSGNGVQAFWLLEQRIDATPDNVRAAEAQGRALARHFGADAVQNVDRIMRLPGTTNLPDAAKKTRGRTAAPARMLGWNGDRYPLRALAHFVAPHAPRDKPDQASTAVAIDATAVFAASAYDDLPRDLRQRFEAACRVDSELRRRWAGDTAGMDDSSRSSLDFAVTGRLRVAGFTPTEAGQLLWVFEHGKTAAICDEQGRDMALRHIRRCWVRQAIATSPAEDFAGAPLPTPPVSADPGGQAVDGPGRLRLELFGDFQIDLDARDLIAGLVPEAKPGEGALAVIYGPTNQGKSLIALSMSAAIATGRPWAGREVSRGTVVFVAGEGVRGIKRRIAALGREVKATSFRDMPIAVVSGPVTVPGSEAELVAKCRDASAAAGLPVRLVVLDTLATVIKGSESADDDMNAFLRGCRAITDQTGATVAVIHHAGKDRTRGARGHSSLPAAADVVLEVDQGKIVVEKLRDDEKPTGPMRFEIRQVVLAQTADGRLVGAPVVGMLGGQEAKDALDLSPADRALDALALRLAREAKPLSTGEKMVRCAEIVREWVLIKYGEGVDKADKKQEAARKAVVRWSDKAGQRCDFKPEDRKDGKWLRFSPLADTRT